MIMKIVDTSKSLSWFIRSAKVSISNAKVLEFENDKFESDKFIFHV